MKQVNLLTLGTSVIMYTTNSLILRITHFHWVQPWS